MPPQAARGAPFTTRGAVGAGRVLTRLGLVRHSALDEQQQRRRYSSPVKRKTWIPTGTAVLLASYRVHLAGPARRVKMRGPVRSSELADLEQMPVRIPKEAADLLASLARRRQESGSPRH
jgi:hypothetical protein